MTPVIQISNKLEKYEVVHDSIMRRCLDPDRPEEFFLRVQMIPEKVVADLQLPPAAFSQLIRRLNKTRWIRPGDEISVAENAGKQGIDRYDVRVHLKGMNLERLGFVNVMMAPSKSVLIDNVLPSYGLSYDILQFSPTKNPAQEPAICTCSMKDLLSTGHNTDCPEKKT